LKDYKTEVIKPTVEQILGKVTPAIKNNFLILRERILKLNNVEEKTTAKFINYYSNGKGMAWFYFPSGKRLELHLRKGKYSDTKRKINYTTGWGSYPVITLKEKEINIDYLFDLLSQAYHK
jgi:predicted transport protein